jgi:hypothetical protein
MSTPMRSAWILVSVLVLGLSACGDSDEPEDASVEDTTVATVVTVDPTVGPETTGAVGDSLPDGTGLADATVECDPLVTMDEAAVLFGAPAEFDPSASYADESAGQLVCAWQTSNDVAPVEVLNVALLTDDRPAGEVIDASLYPAAEPLDLGDEAFIDDSSGLTVGFASGQTAALITWFTFEPDHEFTDDERAAMIELARTVESRL